MGKINNALMLKSKMLEDENKKLTSLQQQVKALENLPIEVNQILNTDDQNDAKPSGPGDRGSDDGSEEKEVEEPNKTE